MMSTPRINTTAAPAYGSRRPVRDWVAVGASASILAASPLWVSEVVIRALRPLGILDTSIARWVALLALPIMLVIAISARAVIWSRSHEPIDAQPLELTPGVQVGTLAAASNLVSRLVTAALLGAVLALIVRSTWPTHPNLGLPVCLASLFAVGMGASLNWRRFPRLSAILMVFAVVLTIILTAGFMGASPHFLTTSSADLAAVSKEVSQRSDSSWRIFSAVVTGLALCLTPALLSRYVVQNRQHFHRPRSVHAGTTMLVAALVTGLLVLLTLSNIADVAAGTFLLRRNVTFAALRAIALPQSVLVGTAVVFFAVTLTAMRNVVDSTPKLAKDLTRGQFLPDYLAHSVDYTGTVAFLTVAGAAVVLVSFDADISALATMFFVSTMTSTASTRWASWRHWRYKLRTEGHSLRRIAMKQARIQALIGLFVAAVILGLFFAVSPTPAAWIAAFLIAVTYLVLYWLRRHQLIHEGQRRRASDLRSETAPSRIHTMVLVQSFDAASERAVQWTLAAHPYSVEIVHVDRDGIDSDRCLQDWRELALPVDLTVVQTSRPYIAKAILAHIARYRHAKPKQVINVVLPEIIYDGALRSLIHNAELRRLKRALREAEGVCLTTVPWRSQRIGQ